MRYSGHPGHPPRPWLLGDHATRQAQPANPQHGQASVQRQRPQSSRGGGHDLRVHLVRVPASGGDRRLRPRLWSRRSVQKNPWRRNGGEGVGAVRFGSRQCTSPLHSRYQEKGCPQEKASALPQTSKPSWTSKRAAAGSMALSDKDYEHVLKSIRKSKNKPARVAQLNGAMNILSAGGKADNCLVAEAIGRPAAEVHVTTDAKGGVLINPASATQKATTRFCWLRAGFHRQETNSPSFVLRDEDQRLALAHGKPLENLGDP